MRPIHKKIPEITHLPELWLKADPNSVRDACTMLPLFTKRFLKCFSFKWRVISLKPFHYMTWKNQWRFLFMYAWANTNGFWRLLIVKVCLNATFFLTCPMNTLRNDFSKFVNKKKGQCNLIFHMLHIFTYEMLNCVFLRLFKFNHPHSITI